MLADGRLDALDGVEVAVLADECGAEGGDELPWVAAGAEERGGELPSLVDLLLLVEQARELAEELCPGRRRAPGSGAAWRGR